MTTYTAQTNFTAGEFSPYLDAREDFDRYNNAAELLKNFVVRATGGAQRRAGSLFISEVADSTQPTRLVPFVFANDQAYVLELSQGLLRVYRNRRLLKGPGDGTELVANGDFSGGSTSWTTAVTGTGAVTFPTAYCQLAAGSGGTALVSQAVTVADDKDYRLQFTVLSGEIIVAVGTAVGLSDLLAPAYFGPGTWGMVFPAIGTTAVIQFYVNFTLTGQIDDVSVQKALTITVTTPWQARDLPQLRWAQSGDVLYFGGINRDNGQPKIPPQKLLRVTLLDWELRPVGFNPPPSIEAPVALASTLTPGTGATVAGTTGVTFVAATGAFLAGDNLKLLQAGAGRAAITAIATGGGSCTADIIDAFSSLTTIPAGSWTILGSPNSNIVPSAKGPAGSTVTITVSSGGADSFRATDVGSFIRGDKGLAQVIAVNSATSVTAHVITPFDSLGPFLAGAWTLEEPSWSDRRGYPEVVGFYEQRSLWAGSAAEPLTFWGSVTGDFENFALGPNDDDAIEYAIASGQFDRLRWIAGLRVALMGTPAGEFNARGGTDTPMTPTTAKVVPQTSYGCDFNVAPVIVGYSALFLQRGATRLREMTYEFFTDTYQAVDLTEYVEHLTNVGLVGLARMTSPLSYLFAVRSDGVLLCCAYLRTFGYSGSLSVVGWSRFITGPNQHAVDGKYESVCVIPQMCGGGDEVWTVVNRTINGAQKRYVEVFDGSVQTDAARVATSDTPFSTVTGLDHLEGALCFVVSDDPAAVGGRVASHVSVSSGSITLPGGVNPSTRIEVGLPYGATLRTMRPELPTKEGTAQARIQRVNKYTVRFMCTGPGVQVGDDLGHLEDYTPTSGARSEDFIREHLGWARESRVVVDQSFPFACTVLGIIREYEVGEGND